MLNKMFNTSFYILVQPVNHFGQRAKKTLYKQNDLLNKGNYCYRGEYITIPGLASDRSRLPTLADQLGRPVYGR